MTALTMKISPENEQELSRRQKRIANKVKEAENFPPDSVVLFDLEKSRSKMVPLVPLAWLFNRTARELESNFRIVSVNKEGRNFRIVSPLTRWQLIQDKQEIALEKLKESLEDTSDASKIERIKEKIKICEQSLQDTGEIIKGIQNNPQQNRLTLGEISKATSAMAFRNKPPLDQLKLVSQEIADMAGVSLGLAWERSIKEGINSRQEKTVGDFKSTAIRKPKKPRKPEAPCLTVDICCEGRGFFHTTRAPSGPKRVSLISKTP